MEGPTTAITTILMHSEQATACRFLGEALVIENLTMAMKASFWTI